MNTTLRHRLRVAILLAAGALATQGAGLAAAGKQTACCFKNPAYTGACSVTPAHGETCGSILAYLNKAGSVGKTYCDNTSIRGGWTRAACTPQ